MAADELYIYDTRIVRMFPDYAGTVIWFSEPVPYPETGLSDGLVAQLSAWEASYYANLDDDFRWRSLTALHRFSSDGLELARAVAAEIGPEFQVEYHSFEDTDAIALLRGEEPASNSAARDVFAARADRARADWAAAQRRLAEVGPETGVVLLARAGSGAAFYRPAAEGEVPPGGVTLDDGAAR
ncbi:hypothetical protein B7R22_11445 [Subtercola boreus]|uniref:Uncharacterized protein n=1 Tax=Subtercola boreus TaxID=120213 RepID=A0A3E0VUZ2_9MICO|nr:hypothetical protein [Subtercola boreus]RFA13862.1 hypothetical protein B7R22_11445 [Subtercola boreus]